MHALLRDKNALLTMYEYISQVSECTNVSDTHSVLHPLKCRVDKCKTWQNEELEYHRFRT